MKDGNVETGSFHSGRIEKQRITIYVEMMLVVSLGSIDFVLCRTSCFIVAAWHAM